MVQNGEECDDGNSIDDDACSNICENATCGDGVVQTGEVCDDGNLQNGDQCNNSCDVTYCGDGIWQSQNGAGTGGINGDGEEQCDN